MASGQKVWVPVLAGVSRDQPPRPRTYFHRRHRAPPEPVPSKTREAGSGTVARSRFPSSDPTDSGNEQVLGQKCVPVKSTTYAVDRSRPGGDVSASDRPVHMGPQGLAQLGCWGQAAQGFGHPNLSNEAGYRLGPGPRPAPTAIGASSQTSRAATVARETVRSCSTRGTRARRRLRTSAG